MFKNYEKKYVKAKPDDDNDNDPDEPDEATEATEATTGTLLRKVNGSSRFCKGPRTSKV